jgi:hypothetical protein
MEEDIEDKKARQKHLQRDINHVFRGINSTCLVCKGFRQRQRQPFKKRKAKQSYLEPISRSARALQTRYGYKVCKVAIYNNENLLVHLPHANSGVWGGTLYCILIGLVSLSVPPLLSCATQRDTFQPEAWAF